MARLQRITPCLWFDNQAEAAAHFYASVFQNSRVLRTTRYSEVGQQFHGKPAGSVMSVVFELDGQSFTALNGGPQFRFSEAISLQVLCETQQEVDYYWGRLSEGGEEGPCGWLKDRFGLSWQVTPTVLYDMIQEPGSAKAQRALNAMFQMRKFDIAALKQAYGE